MRSSTLIWVLILGLAALGCGVTTRSEGEKAAPGDKVDKVGDVPVEVKLPTGKAATKPEIGMGYSVFTSICKPDKYDSFERIEDGFGITAVVRLTERAAGRSPDCVGTFVFNDFRLASMSSTP